MRYKRKWCRLYKSKNHDDTECIAHKNSDSKSLSHDSKYKINNVEKYTISYLFVNQNSNKPLKILLDSGASLSFINPDICNYLKFNIHKCESFFVKLANVHGCEISEFMNLTITNNNTKQYIKMKVYIMKGLNEDIIIGSDTISKLKIILDLANKKILIDKESFPINDAVTDKILFIDINNNKETESCDNTIKNIINTYNSKINLKSPIINVKFSILTVSNQISTRKPYPIPLHQKNLFKEEIDRLLKEKIITRSRSMFSAPCFIKKRPDKTGRILVDYGDLNKISQKMEYSFPDIQESFYRMHGMKYFSEIDPRKGFYQVKINNDD
ncbi:Retrovirus-related Pol polyprotein from transposon opus [Dictyocoela muelleri]|nr:Retrovirus-related Pol polyprotein from transposon opus [Dictyocoela muelleri]